MVGQKSRLLVLTVLGVQSTGKSTLLNTMFGVQFAVSSGRCTRGAYMIFIPVGEDLKEELQCDFVLLIDTEGLKSPALAKLEDSYEHDNELATFVIGLGDVTIINIAMENSAEMKDVLQIAVHAFLRMKAVGKKTVCHFVHQNVAGVSAHDKNKTDRNQLLEQLNEMTVIAAEMEKRPNVRKFTDVLDYDVEKNNWYIPGLWHGTPPMASVNTGYSAAVFDFKKNLLEMLKIRQNVEPFQIPDFIEWMSDLWRAVKYENFIFSFRNSLVAHAYDNLCKEFIDWEWTYQRHIESWITSASNQISNSLDTDIPNVFGQLEVTVENEIVSQTQKIIGELNKYYKRKDRHVHLVEKYKTDFANNINFLERKMKDEVRKRFNEALEMREGMKITEQIHREKTKMIEQQVLQLLQNNRHCKNQMSDEDLKAEFEKMWKKQLGNISALKEKNVSDDVRRQLVVNLRNLNVTEDLQRVQDLTKCGLTNFIVNENHITVLTKIKSFFTQQNVKYDLDTLALEVIGICNRIIDQHTQSKHDYQTTYIKDVLEKIDKQLQKAESKINAKFALDLKLHICGIAARKFTKMHKNYLAEQDPVRKMEESKSQYQSDFIDSYKEKDQCQRKAQVYVHVCLKPAIITYINQSIGIDIADEILKMCPNVYSSRKLFQYTIQKELLENCNFNDFLSYISEYESFVDTWITNHIFKCFSKDMTLQNLKIKRLNLVTEKIMEAVETSKCQKDGSFLPNTVEGTSRFIQNLHQALCNVLTISRNNAERVFFNNNCCCHSFTKSLCVCLNDFKEDFAKDFSNNVQHTLSNAFNKPQNKLFERVIGCGKKCPFCKTPCEAVGKTHSQHFAVVHRPRGLSGAVYTNSGVLIEEICSSSVLGNGVFESYETNFQPHPCKDYQTFYPDWFIAPDQSVEASDYWKFVLVTFNNRFAKEFKVKPAVYPDDWKQITKDQALISLELLFNDK